MPCAARLLRLRHKLGAARLRLTLSATHEPEHIDGLVAALRDVLGSNHRELASSAPTP